MKLHWSVMVVLAVCIVVTAGLVWQDKVNPTFLVTAVAGIIGWLLPSPLVSKGGSDAPPPSP